MDQIRGIERPYEGPMNQIAEEFSNSISEFGIRIPSYPMKGIPCGLSMPKKLLP